MRGEERFHDVLRSRKAVGYSPALTLTTQAHPPLEQRRKVPHRLPQPLLKRHHPRHELDLRLHHHPWMKRKLPAISPVDLPPDPLLASPQQVLPEQLHQVCVIQRRYHCSHLRHFASAFLRNSDESSIATSHCCRVCLFLSFAAEEGNRPLDRHPVPL